MEYNNHVAENNNNKDDLYETRIVLFLDVLGFSEKVKTCDSLTIKTLLDDLYNYIATLKDNARFDDVRITTFSDSVVISVECNQSSTVELLYRITGMQMLYLIKGFLTRAGLSAGEFYHSDKMVFGVPLVEAYHNEYKANQPLIYLEDSYFNYTPFENKVTDKLLKKITMSFLSIANNKKGYTANFIEIAHKQMIERIDVKTRQNHLETTTYCFYYYAFWAGLLDILVQEETKAIKKAKPKISFLIHTLHNLNEKLFYKNVNNFNTVDKTTLFAFKDLKPNKEYRQSLFDYYKTLTLFKENERTRYFKELKKRIKQKNKEII